MIIFENIDLFIIIIILLALSISSIMLALRSYTQYRSLLERYELFMTGRDAESLEEFFLDLQNDIDFLLDNDKKHRENLKTLNRVIKRAYQKIGVYKYDAFEEKSGKRSFAIALLDYTNSGFVITCQNVGASSVLFVKEVDTGTTAIKLGPEEEKALIRAIKQTEKEIKEDDE